MTLNCDKCALLFCELTRAALARTATLHYSCPVAACCASATAAIRSHAMLKYVHKCTISNESFCHKVVLSRHAVRQASIFSERAGIQCFCPPVLWTSVIEFDTPTKLIDKNVVEIRIKIPKGTMASCVYSHWVSSTLQ